MNIKLRLLTFLSLVAFAFFITACGEEAADTAEDTTESVLNSGEETTSQLQTSTERTAANAETNAEPTGPTTSVEFAEERYDFGQVKSGETVRHTYEFTNTGNEPLIISNVKPGCGCTAPTWTKTPVAPGEKGEVVLEYAAKGKGKQTKNATITANTNPATKQIYFTAEVLPEG